MFKYTEENNFTKLSPDGFFIRPEPSEITEIINQYLLEDPTRKAIIYLDYDTAFQNEFPDQYTSWEDALYALVKIYHILHFDGTKMIVLLRKLKQK